MYQLMKTQPENHTSLNEINQGQKLQRSFSLDTTLSSLSDIRNVCSGNKRSTHLCMEESCQATGYLCEDQECQCQAQHEQCSKILTKSLTRVLRKKVVRYKPLQIKFSAFFQHFIDIVSDKSQIILSKCHEDEEYWFGGLDNQIKFMKCLQEGNQQEIKGKFVRQIEANKSKLSKDAIKMKRVDTDVAKLCQQIQHNFLTLCEKIEANLDWYRSGSFFGSDIVKGKSQTTKIEEFFPNRRIRNANLLYRATQNDFEGVKFHQKCNGKTNTLVLCETQFGQVVGAFTPLAWIQNGAWNVDNTIQTFVFSLTNNHKFVQKNQQNNMLGQVGTGPYFYGFVIPNKANQQNCTVNFAYAYQNSQYTNTSQCYQLFSGSQNGNFRLREWQVYQLQFQV